MRQIGIMGILCIFFLGAAGVCAADDLASTFLTREEIIKAITDTYQQEFGQVFPATNPKVKITGSVRASFGIESDGTAVFNRSNADLNERNWRLFSSEDLNNRQNTYDPAIYDRLKVVVDAAVADAVAVHLNLTVDPWSYTGKTGETTVTSGWGDTANVQQLYWGNNGYTVNHTINTKTYGGYLGLQEVKVKDGKVPATTMGSNVCNEWGQCDQFNIPEMRLKYTFQPIREMWVDLKMADAGKLRIFPMAYEDQALTTDDPLHLSNNREWWEESPWIDDWRGGQVNHTNGNPPDFTKGIWDRGLAFSVRDSDATRLTALRGVALDLSPTEETSVKATVASPKTLWQDYNEVTAVPGSVRVKQFMGDQMYVGATGNMHLGLVDKKVDKKNYVGSVDAGIAPVENVKVLAQVSTSQSSNDITDPIYRTKQEGQAYYASIEAVSSAIDILKTDYLAQRRMEGGGDFYKTRLYAARMDKNFESSLSNYHETRDDAFWSRHLTYYPSPYRKLPGIPGATMGEADVAAFAVGNGIDYGRKVVGWRGNATLDDGKLDGMVDVRHVTTNENQKVEDVARTIWNYQATEKLTTKALGVWHSVPQTTAGIDPFIVSGDTGENLVSRDYPGGRDATLKTGAMGARYQLTDWADVSGVWEHTNDMTLGTDNFPQGLYSSGSSRTYTENGVIYRVPLPFLYNQGVFPQAPYVYHNIFKTALHLQPTAIWDVYVDYTRNPNKFAGQIDDNMNHVGLETSVVPNKHLGFYARYTMSRGYDLNLINQATPELKYCTYHNVFLEGRYVAPKENIFSLSYGVGPAFIVNTSASNPLLGFYLAPVVTTEHIVRMSYEKKF